MTSVVRSVRLFLEYMLANPDERASYLLYQNFAKRLYTGTFDRATGIDPSGLCWRPRSNADCSSIIGTLSDFFNWLEKMRPGVAELNPRFAGSAYDQMLDEAGYQYRRNSAFLGHTWSEHAPPDGSKRNVRARRLGKLESIEPPAFPDDKFMDLLARGFYSRGRHDYRGILIALLLHGAGFRDSEPFHLYIEDVFPDPSNPKCAKVLIHEPRFAPAPATWRDKTGRRRKGNRASYLAEAFGLAPRTEMLGSQHAGWKGGIHIAPGYIEAYWFRPEYGEIFLRVWYLYLAEVAEISRNHPFAFINLQRGQVGAMYCIGQFNKAHAAACRRIGLPVSKLSGTTPHGHRHAYGRRLKNASVAPALIRRFMHHSSLESQAVYTKSTTTEIRDALQQGAKRLITLNTELAKAPSFLLLDTSTQ